MELEVASSPTPQYCWARIGADLFSHISISILPMDRREDTHWARQRSGFCIFFCLKKKWKKEYPKMHMSGP
jgi:hypothetical protein